MRYCRLPVLITAIFWLLLIGCTTPASDQGTQKLTESFDSTDWQVDSVTHEALANWRLLGEGEVFTTINAQTCLMESESSQGVVLLSPTYYKGDVVVKYKALALTGATVFVTMLSATDTVAPMLDIPEDYDGGMNLWVDGAANYFFAFKNASHGGTPYIAKNPGFTIETVAPDQDRMVAGIYYDIEVGRQGSQLWLSVDGQQIIAWKDDHPIEGGHIAVRLRGTAGLAASGLLKDMVIYSK